MLAHAPCRVRPRPPGAAAILAASVAAALAIPRPAFPFEVMGVCDGGTPTHWPAGQAITVHVSVTAVSDDLASAAVRSALADAWAEWDHPACADVKGQVGEPTVSEPFAENPDEVVLGFYEQERPPELGEGLLALTRVAWDSASCEILDGDVAFEGIDSTWTMAEPQEAGEADFLAVLTHELGHLLGLDHSAVAGSTMAFPYPYDISWRTLGCDDSGAVCDLYERGDASCGDSAYCPCDNPCSGGVCQGLTFEEGATECWSWFEQDEQHAEEEPNDDSTEATRLLAEGGDLVIRGSSESCGSEGGSPSGDLDWIAVDAPCGGRAWVSLEPDEAGADMDLFVFVDGEIAAEDQGRGEGEVAAVEVAVEGDLLLHGWCWSGPAGAWTMRVHYLAPGEQPPGIDDPGSCTCSQGASGTALLAAALVLVAFRLASRGAPWGRPRACHPDAEGAPPVRSIPATSSGTWDRRRPPAGPR